MQYEDNIGIDTSALTLISKFTNNRNNVLEILNYARVLDGTMTATDLETTVKLKNVPLPNGLYLIDNKAPVISAKEDIEFYPKIPIYNADESFEFNISSNAFEFFLQKLLLSVGNDDLRPVMSGISLIKTENNEIFLTSTDAHTLCKLNITKHCTFSKNDKEFSCIMSINYLKEFVNLTNGNLTFKCNKTNIFIDSENIEYISRTIDGVYPKYNLVIPYTTSKQITLDIQLLKKSLKLPQVLDLIAKYKSEKFIEISFYNNGNKLFVKASEVRRYNASGDVKEILQIGEMNVNYKELENSISVDESLFLFMPLMGEKTKENDYDFYISKKVLEKLVNSISESEAKVLYNSETKAYIIKIDSKDVIFEKPKSIIKKVEVKKEVKVVSPKPKKVAETPKADADKLELDEAIETLNLLLETLPKEEHKEIKEAIEILKMLK
jgi:DNA polymerase III sliding clamp (beta) subunit (PCNA family)